MEKSRSKWALMGVIVASAALAPKLEALRIAVPSETRLTRMSAAQANEDGKPLAFNVPAGSLGDLDVSIQQLSREVPKHPSVVQLTGV